MRDAEGRWFVVESKNGPGAALNSWQVSKYSALAEEGGIPVGQNALNAGFEVGVPVDPIQPIGWWFRFD